MANLPISGIFNITATYGQKGKYWANGHQGLDIICDNKTIYAACDGTEQSLSSNEQSQVQTNLGLETIDLVITYDDDTTQTYKIVKSEG